MFRRVLDVVAGCLLATALLGFGAHFLSGTQNVLVALAALSSQLMALAPVAGVLFGVGRRRGGAAAAGLLTVAAAVTVLPTYVPDGGSAGGARLAVLTANLRLGDADPASVVDAARAERADVLLLQELTPAERGRLADAGLDDLLPYSLVDAGRGADGVGLWSRYPLADEQHHGGLVFAAVSARLQLGAGRPSPTVLTVHMPGPWPQPAADWVHDITHLPALLGEVAADADAHGSTVLVGGDFNATYGNAQFRALLAGGFADAAEQTGAAWTATYPSGYGIPPLIGIDHVLLREARASDVGTVTVAGSDHRGLVVRVDLGG